MKKEVFYKCSDCGREYEFLPFSMLCIKCQQFQEKERPLKGILEVCYNNISLKNYLPVEKKYFPQIPVGNTPFWKPKLLNTKYNFKNIYIKNDSLNPTFSLKDRASFLVAAMATKFNIKKIVLASTGNAASSMAGIGAAAGLKTVVFLPEEIPKAKLIQSIQYGAEIIKVKGDYDLAFEKALKYSKENKILCRNTGYNPLTIEGKKTVSFEIFESLEKIPDYIFLPVGDGVILSGVYKGFIDLLKIGKIKKIPTIIGVQAEKSNAISKALKNNGFYNKVTGKTIADSISVKVPAAGYYCLKKLIKYNGFFVEVSDNEILNAQKELAKLTGIFAEPSAAASYAGFKKIYKKINKNSQIVLLITGSGLKDIKGVCK